MRKFLHSLMGLASGIFGFLSAVLALSVIAKRPHGVGPGWEDCIYFVLLAILCGIWEKD